MTDNREPARIGVTVQLTEEQTQALAAGQAVDVVVRLMPDASATDGLTRAGTDGFAQAGTDGFMQAGTGVPATAVPADDGTPSVDGGVVRAGEGAGDVGESVPRRAVVSLDSTLSEAEALFRSAIVSLDAIPGNEIEGISPLYHVSNFDGPDAMAAVVQLTTRLDARALIGALGAIEAAHADQLDCDLIDMEGVVSDEPDCRVPWPSAAQRAQVLAPWFDMDPDARLGGDPVSFLLAMAPDAGRVGVLSDDWIIGEVL